ncbi:unnamed protein product [Calypogeia fissa]
MLREAMTNWQHTCGGAVSFPTGIVTWTWKRMWLTSPSHRRISGQAEVSAIQRMQRAKTARLVDDNEKKSE